MPRPEILIPLSVARRDRALLKAELRGERRATLRLLKSLGVKDASGHIHGEHGRFAAGGGPPPAQSENSSGTVPAQSGNTPSPPPGVDHISTAVADAVAGLDQHQASHVTLLAVRAATKAHAALARLTPAMFRALDTLGLVFDTPDDLRKFGWSPGTSGTATGDAMAAGDPVRAATGVPSHIAAAVAAKVLGAGLVWARQQLGMSPMVKKAEEAPDFAGLAAVLAEAFGAVAAELGVDAPDPAAVMAALGASPLAKAVPAGDADDYGPLYEAALEAVIHARETGDDDAVAGIVEAYREHLDTGGAIHKAGKWDTNKHPRNDHGQFVSRDAIADAKGNPEKEEALREKVTDPEEREKLDNALAGTTDLGRTKAGQRKHEAGQRRAKKAADHARAGEIADKIGAGTATHEDMHELGDHLEGLTVDKLRALQSRIPTAGRTPRKADMVRALRDSLERSAHAKRVGDGAARVEQRPAADHARLALAGMQPNRYDVTTAGGEVVPAGKGYQRWEGGGKAVGYTAEQAAKVAAGVTADHADRRIAEHEAATVADGLDDVQREYHATVADQLRAHKEKVFGGPKPGGPTPADIEDASRQMRDMDRERQVREDDDAEYENRKANWDNWEDKRDRMEAWERDKPDSLAAQGAAAAARGRMAPPDRGGSVGTVPAAGTTREPVAGAQPIAPTPAKISPGRGPEDDDPTFRPMAGGKPARPIDPDRPKVEYVRAPAGGQVSDVDGRHYAGGQLMPTHGLYSGQPKAPKGNGVGTGGPVKPNEDAEGGSRRQPAQPLTPEQIAERHERAADQKKWDEMNAGPLGKVTWLGNTPNSKAMGNGNPELKKWREYAESIGPEGVKHIIDTLEPEYHAFIDSHYAKRRAENQAKKDAGQWNPTYDREVAEDEGQWDKDHLKTRGEEAIGMFSGSKKHEKKVPGSHYARELVGEMLNPQNHPPGTSKIDIMHRMNGILAGKPSASSATDPHLAPVLAAHDAAPAGSKLRDYLDAAVANASPAGHDASNPPKSLTPEQGRKLRKELASAHADAHANGHLSPEDDAAFGKVMQGLGVKPLHEVGATVPFDPATMESSSGVSTGTPVTVGRRGWSGLYGDAKTGHENVGNNVRRAVVAPASPAGAEPAVPPAKGKKPNVAKPAKSAAAPPASAAPALPFHANGLPDVKPGAAQKPDDPAYQAAGKALLADDGFRKNLADAWNHQKLFVEHRDGMIPLSRVYWEMQKRQPGVTLDQFHAAVDEISRTRGAEMHVLNEISKIPADEREATINRNDRHYHFLRFLGGADAEKMKPTS